MLVKIPIVPCYCFGEQIAYETSDFMLPFRKWLQHNLGMGMPIPKSLRPNHLKDFVVVVGKPIAWGDDDTVNTMHAKYVSAIHDIFYNNREKFPEYAKRELVIERSWVERNWRAYRITLGNSYDILLFYRSLFVPMDRHHAHALDLAALDQLWASRDCHDMLPELQCDVARYFGSRKPCLIERDCTPLRAEQLPSLVFRRKHSLWVVDESTRRVARARCVDDSKATSLEPIRNGYRVCYEYDDTNDRLYAFDCEYHRIFVYNPEDPEFCREIDVGTYDEYALSSKFRCLDGLVFLAYVNTERTIALRMCRFGRQKQRQ
ncbi:hypothetical protein FOZ60_013316 [Perkinsus olseni]|uniref:Uncharacterized protein n=1 Tax=Perkinsus olseni TaxID=32597 RepID=A0A7J6PLD8_PEROL|nr:hypothetical protein FOZ60_013316 [Perkinsus olseni]